MIAANHTPTCHRAQLQSLFSICLIQTLQQHDSIHPLFFHKKNQHKLPDSTLQISRLRVQHTLQAHNSTQNYATSPPIALHYQHKKKTAQYFQYRVFKYGKDSLRDETRTDQLLVHHTGRQKCTYVYQRTLFPPNDEAREGRPNKKAMMLSSNNQWRWTQGFGCCTRQRIRSGVPTHSKSSMIDLKINEQTYSVQHCSQTDRHADHLAVEVFCSVECKIS